MTPLIFSWPRLSSLGGGSSCVAPQWGSTVQTITSSAENPVCDFVIWFKAEKSTRGRVRELWVLKKLRSLNVCSGWSLDQVSRSSWTHPLQETRRSMEQLHLHMSIISNLEREEFFPLWEVSDEDECGWKKLQWWRSDLKNQQETSEILPNKTRTSVCKINFIEVF